MSKISKRVRNEAAIICSATSALRLLPRSVADIDASTGTVGRELGFSLKACDLAHVAWANASSEPGEPRHAEAEAMIREGWSPLR